MEGTPRVQGFGDWMTEEDLLVELPGTVWINNYPFVLLETDKVRKQYLSRVFYVERNHRTPVLKGSSGDCRVNMMDPC